MYPFNPIKIILNRLTIIKNNPNKIKILIKNIKIIITYFIILKINIIIKCK